MADKKISALTSATTPLAGTEVLPIVQSASTVKVTVNDMLAVTNWTSPAVNSEGNMFLRATDSLATDVGTQIGLGGKYNASSYFPFAAVAGRKENATNNNVAGYLSLLTTTSGGTLTERMRISSAGDATVNTGNLVIGTSGKGIDFSASSHAAGMTSELLNDYEEGTWTVVWTNLTGTPASTTGYYTKIGRVVYFTYSAGSGSITATAASTRFSLPYTPSIEAAGTQISQNVTFSSSTLILPSNSSCYVGTFTSNFMVFSGTYTV